LSASPDRLLVAIDPTSRAALESTLRPVERPEADALWSLVMVGAIQVGRQTPEGGETLWFNPLFDAGLAVRWRQSSNGWRIVATAPILGETLRGEPEPASLMAGRPAWLELQPSMASALRESCDRSARGIASQVWIAAIDAPASVRAARSKIAIARASRGYLQLRELGLVQGYQDATRTVRRALVEHDESAGPVPAALRSDLDRIGEAGRLSLRPVAAFKRPDGWSIALQSPDAPAFTIFAHFVHPKPSDNAALVAFTAASALANPDAAIAQPESAK
jgi:hypothetical protein